MKAETIYQRINITLPRQTLSLVRRVSKPGDRSRLIDHALLYYLNKTHQIRVRKELIEGYRSNSQTNREMAKIWRPLEEEVWQKAEQS
ncbi:MAG TPA: hypothetical protein VJI73_02020 [Candidatus Paceibacterota bacterium]